MVKIEDVKELCEKNLLRWTNHVIVRLLQRNIRFDDVVCALKNGEIIEQYPSDYPYPSCLILGATVNNSRIHVVCGVGNNELWLITAYYPSFDKWDNDFKLRMERKKQ